MARAVGSLVGEKDFLSDYLVSKAFIAAQLVVKETATTEPGEADDPAGTGSGGVTDTLDVLGCTTDQATYSATATQNPGAFWPPTAGTLENLVRIEVNPFAIYRFPVSGGATAGTALAQGTGSGAGNIIAISTAGSRTVLTAAGVTGNIGTIDMTGGLVMGRTGANVGQIRKLTAYSASTSQTVTVQFLNLTVAGDTFIRVPYSRMISKAQMTTDFSQMNGLIACNNAGAVASLGALRVVNVIIDEQRDLAWVDVIAADHAFNPESA